MRYSAARGAGVASGLTARDRSVRSRSPIGARVPLRVSSLRVVAVILGDYQFRLRMADGKDIDLVDSVTQLSARFDRLEELLLLLLFVPSGPVYTGL